MEGMDNLVNFFECKKITNPLFFYAVEYDNENRLRNVFWRDERSKTDYKFFGDVVVFDTTYRTTKYNMICAPLIGVNHHCKSVFFGCAFIKEADIPTFTWLLKTFKLSMGNKAPKSIITNQDYAMRKAMKEVVPRTRHRLCLWSILKKVDTDIGPLYEKPEFKDKINKLFHSCESDFEFSFLWRELVANWGVDKNTWLQRLYDIRGRWCHLFTNDMFVANIKSTERSEITNNIFEQMTCESTSLMDFVKHYEERLINRGFMRYLMISHLIKKSQKIHVQCGILEHAAEVYTHNVFKMFQEEFLKGENEKVTENHNDGVHFSYNLRREGYQTTNRVHFNSWNCVTVCSCKLFESNGWLCAHALKVLNLKVGVKKIPSQYNMKRWTKQAKKRNKRLAVEEIETITDDNWILKCDWKKFVERR